MPFSRGASVVQFSPWTFALVGGPMLVDGNLDTTRFSDRVIEFDQENYVWKARFGIGTSSNVLMRTLAKY